MRAGKLDKTITLQRFTSTVDDYGTPIETWTDLATVRAQIIQATTEEFMKGWGASTEAATVFRIRHMDGITPADRVTYQGRAYDLKEIKELGRREGLDLRCVATGSA
ncbi:phage head closure protein [Shinella zoogloeoides]|uniref:phage head closure protein n=1 Tax=Shinella zoogloeoides TaxID=352475 RepID=UPI0028AC60D2|nr:phage head closure protein [Shinella zoogloeoides]